VLHSAGLSQNFHFLAKMAKVGTLTFWQKGKSLGYPTPDRAGFVEPHEPKKCISRTEHSSALIWFGLLG